jgi:hypothetical protein
LSLRSKNERSKGGEVGRPLSCAINDASMLLNWAGPHQAIYRGRKQARSRPIRRDGHLMRCALNVMPP